MVPPILLILSRPLVQQHLPAPSRLLGLERPSLPWRLLVLPILLTPLRLLVRQHLPAPSRPLVPRPQLTPLGPQVRLRRPLRPAP